MFLKADLLAFSSEGGGSILGGHKFLERKIGGHEIVDDPNVGSYKMTTGSVFILFKRLISIQFESV